MAKGYDDYYQTPNLFGEPYPELIDFFKSVPHKGKLLDLGCGQGRDALAIAQLGYEVTGVDNSEVGIKQLNEQAKKNGLNITGLVADIYAFEDFGSYDFILLDSMLHFNKKDKEKEVGLVKNIIKKAKAGATLVVCIQNNGDKVGILKETLRQSDQTKVQLEIDLWYTFHDDSSGHSSRSAYKIIIAKIDQ